MYRIPVQLQCLQTLRSLEEHNEGFDLALSINSAMQVSEENGGIQENGVLTSEPCAVRLWTKLYSSLPNIGAKCCWAELPNVDFRTCESVE